ncbi:MAG: Hsp20/alpha crystallin family protein [bacterium]|nr:Hsp20/alpha crystallin family protein [bacterium]
MTLKHLVPWYSSPKSQHEPFFALQKEVNDLFERFFALESPVGKSFTPKLDIKETEKDIQVMAEIPGVDEKDIEVTLHNGRLTISGEKKSEIEDKKEGYHRIERTYGSFCRTIPLPDEIDEDKVEATYKKGVLKVVLPKTAKAQEGKKKIKINAE